MIKKQKILIIGAGFAGVFAAKKLDELLSDQAEITLVSNSPHFEFHANFYRVVADRSPMQACFPLSQIFKETNVNIVTDTIINFNLKNNVAQGLDQSTYHFDYAILGLGSQNAFFGIKGVSNYSHSLRNINEALKLSRHIHDTLQEKSDTNDKSLTEIVIIGGGPTGVELSGELAVHSKKLAKLHDIPEQNIKVRLIEALDRILAFLDPKESEFIKKHLEHLGVDVELNSKVSEEIKTGLTVNNKVIKTTTVVWTSGVKASSRYQDWGFTVAKNGRAAVNKSLQSSNNPKIYIAGDGADVQGTGTAWPAIDQGELAATNIYNSIQKNPQLEYIAKKYPTIIPVGSNWAFVKLENGTTISGKKAWIFRQWHILQFYLKILPISEAVAALKSGGEICSVCQKYNHYDNHLER